MAKTVAKYIELESNTSRLTTPGKRLRYLRDKLIGRSRAYIEKKYKIPKDTLKVWEYKKTKLTQKAVNKCLKIYRNEGILVSESWIAEGLGPMPQLFSHLDQSLQEISPTYEYAQASDHQLLLQEADYFKKIAPNSVIFQVINEEMAPWYSPGDYVGGRCKYDKQIKTALGKDCIVKTKDNKIYFRRLFESNKKGRYNLLCLNPSWSATEPVIFDAQIDYAAPVIWHRCPEE
ncbi:MAG: hypothetical protein JW855_01780 [Gammaproteobacteria bacterium]|nr:hypothetical protein [Gammaproteobacteria bacterium]